MLDGITAQELIARALAPGVSLTALILYNSSLQGRFMSVTARIRDLDKEVRALRAEDSSRHAERIASARRQVALMVRRSHAIRRAVLAVYGSFASMILTVIFLAGSLGWRWLDQAALGAFSLGFVFLGLAVSLSSREMYMAMRTMEDPPRGE